MYYDDSYRNHGRFSLYSLVLLVIFVSAAVLILVAAIWRPWSDDDATVAAPIHGSQDVPLPGDISVADPNSLGAETGAEVVSGQ